MSYHVDSTEIQRPDQSLQIRGVLVGGGIRQAVRTGDIGEMIPATVSDCSKGALKLPERRQPQTVILKAAVYEDDGFAVTRFYISESLAI